MIHRLQKTIRPLHRSFATASSSSTPSHKIFSAALPHVHNYGWTEQALAQGVLTSNLPPSYIGLINDKKSDMIHFFMQDCNARLSHALQQKDDVDLEGMSHSNVIEWAIRTRLEMNVPFVRSKRWAEGMALGAMPLNVYETANHLEELVNIIESGMMRCKGNGHASATSNTKPQALGLLERGAIGAVYVATELHLLSDESVDCQETWTFLNQRVKGLEAAAQNNFSGLIPSSDTLVAGAAVASSLGGAVLSIVAPAAAAGVQSFAGSIVPQIMKFMQPPSVDSTVGTKSQDYDLSDLPPFETDKDSSKK